MTSDAIVRAREARALTDQIKAGSSEVDRLRSLRALLPLGTPTCAGRSEARFRFITESAAVSRFRSRERRSPNPRLTERLSLLRSAPSS
jgi:hypothetical protein